MNEEKFYEPFIIKLTEWVAYEENCPKSDYMQHKEEHDAFRVANDRDCILTGGDLNADTIFSLWLPLRHAIVRLNSKEDIKALGGIRSKYSFCKILLNGDNLEKLLPSDNDIVKELRKLFVLGLKRCNVMILPERWLNSKRGMSPYFDYVPRFLYELFPGGDFANVFETEDELVNWIKRENLQMLFKNGIISRKTIIDLSGSGSIKVSLAPDGEEALLKMLHNYCMILQLRDLYY